MTRKQFIALSALITAFAVAAPFACSETLEETYYRIPSQKVSSEVKIAFLSDFHSSHYGKRVRELVDSVKGFDPDIVIFGGDLFDNHRGEYNSVLLAEQLTALYPCYYSIGNHETYGEPGEEQLIKADMSELGVTVLDGKSADVTVNGTSLRLHGIDGAAYTDQLEACEAAVSADMYNIMLDHYPEEFPLLSGKGFDLILSGHAHGGQWRFPPLINGVYAPGQGIFPKYTCGIYTENNTAMLVSRGLQRSLRDCVFPRIFNRPETVYITISPQ